MSRFWLVKQEPSAYSWNQFLKDKSTPWTGVRNFQARNFLRAMKKGDPVLFYHSVTDKQIVGLARVGREAYPDPTATEGDWSCVTLEAVKTLKYPVTLGEIKANSSLKNIPLLRQSRLSVMPLKSVEYHNILQMSFRPSPEKHASR